jgi:hypothetical protein
VLWLLCAGIDRSRVEDMEARLKADVLREAARYEQHILVTEEDDDMNVSSGRGASVVGPDAQGSMCSSTEGQCNRQAVVCHSLLRCGSASSRQLPTLLQPTCEAGDAGDRASSVASFDCELPLFDLLLMCLLRRWLMCGSL